MAALYSILHDEKTVTECAFGKQQASEFLLEIAETEEQVYKLLETV